MTLDMCSHKEDEKLWLFILHGLHSKIENSCLEKNSRNILILSKILLKMSKKGKIILIENWVYLE